MRVVIPLVFLMVAWPISALAQETPTAEATPRAGGFFRAKRVSFWGDAPLADKKPESSRPEKESIFAEPIRLPDGRVTVYVPPKAVLDFLETPDEESGKAYLAWQRARMEKLSRAAEILARLTGRAAPPEGEAPPRALPEEKAAPKADSPPATTAKNSPRRFCATRRR